MGKMKSIATEAYSRGIDYKRMSLDDLKAILDNADEPTRQANRVAYNSKPAIYHPVIDPAPIATKVRKKATSWLWVTEEAKAPIAAYAKPTSSRPRRPPAVLPSSGSP